MKWINYHHLIYFKEIANHGSISKASEFLKVGQPALSSQLKNFEEFLDVQLFERKNRKLILTEAGRVTLEYANKIGDLGQELLNVIENKGFTKEIQLSVGALDGIPKSLISDIVDFAHKKTGCFLSVYEGSIDSLLRKLLAHQIELIISDHEIGSLKKENIFSRRIFRGQVVAVASDEYRDLRRNFPQSLNDVPVILPTSHSTLRKDIEHYFHLNDIKPKLIGETQDTSLQKILASKGDGIIFLPEFSIKQLQKDGKLIKIGTVNQVFSEYHLIYSKRIIGNPALDLILDQEFFKKPKVVI